MQIDRCSSALSLCLSTYRDSSPILNQAAIVQFNRTEDTVAPSTSVHIKFIGVVGLMKGVDSKLPLAAGGVEDLSTVACCGQVVLSSPLTGGEIWSILPALEMTLQAYSSVGTMVWPSGQMFSESTDCV